MIKNFTIFGERHCSTNYTQKIVSSTFNIPFTAEFGHKHWYGFREIKEEEETLFLFCVRNPYDWIIALFTLPHEVTVKDKKNLISFLSNEWRSSCYGPTEIMEERDMDTKQRYTNIFAMRKKKMNYILDNFRFDIKNFEIIRYEDMENEEEKTLKRISMKYKLEYNQVKSSFKKPKLHYKKIDREIFSLIDSQIDWETEIKFGYYPFFCFEEMIEKKELEEKVLTNKK